MTVTAQNARRSPLSPALAIPRPPSHPCAVPRRPDPGDRRFAGTGHPRRHRPPRGDHRTSARGLPTGPDDILVTTGSQQALSLLATALLEPGGHRSRRKPCYLAALQAFGFAGAWIVAVPGDAEGLDPAALGELVVRERPKLLYTVPTFQNPTGRMLTAERRPGARPSPRGSGCAGRALLRRRARPLHPASVFRDADAAGDRGGAAEAGRRAGGQPPADRSVPPEAPRRLIEDLPLGVLAQGRVAVLPEVVRAEREVLGGECLAPRRASWAGRRRRPAGGRSRAPRPVCRSGPPRSGAPRTGGRGRPRGWPDPSSRSRPGCRRCGGPGPGRAGDP